MSLTYVSTHVLDFQLSPYWTSVSASSENLIFFLPLVNDQDVKGVIILYFLFCDGS